MNIYEVTLYEENQTPATWKFDKAEEAFAFIVEEQRNGGWMDKRFICDVVRVLSPEQEAEWDARMAEIRTSLEERYGTLFDNGE